MEMEKLIVGEKCIPKIARTFNTLAEPQNKNAIINANDTYNKISNKLKEIEKEKQSKKEKIDDSIIKPEDVREMIMDNKVQYLVNRGKDDK